MNKSNFDEESYLDANPDVAEAVISGAFKNGYEHYLIHGKNEGRMLKKLFEKSRNDKVFNSIKKKGLGLEIGPSHNPLAPKKKGFSVHILDHASAKDLRNKYRDHGVNIENIEEVDFVWKGEPLHELIGNTKCYDWIIASHVIEHVPDFISFLQQCEILLKDDGIISLVIPDKRYCFDYFSQITSTGEVLDAHLEKRQRPSSGQIFNHIANAAKRNGNIAWGPDNNGGADQLVHEFHEAKSHFLRSKETSDYIDVHCWRFTPSSFKLIISDINQLNLIDMEVRNQFNTVGCEFYISLGKVSKNPTEIISRFSMLSKIKNEIS